MVVAVVVVVVVLVVVPMAFVRELRLLLGQRVQSFLTCDLGFKMQCGRASGSAQLGCDSLQ